MSEKKTQHLVRFDWAMKNILRNKANFDILEGFLTSLLNEKITVKSFYDIKNRNVIECVTSANFPRVVSVDIIYSTPLEENKDYIYRSSVNIVGCHSKNQLLTDFRGRFPEYFIIYVNNFKGEIQEKIDEWMYFFKTESIKSKFSAPGIKEAEKKLSYLAMPKEAQDEYDRYMDALHYEESTLETAVAEGELRGEIKGRAEGEAIGLEKGIAEAVRRMANSGMSVAQVGAIIGISEQDISAILKG